MHQMRSLIEVRPDVKTAAFTVQNFTNTAYFTRPCWRLETAPSKGRGELEGIPLETLLVTAP